jgi:uncharacterized protein (TIGR03435 family)
MSPDMFGFGLSATRQRKSPAIDRLWLPGGGISQQEWQISGPSWLTDEKFELAATMPEGTTKDVARLMLRRMLIERFGLRYHQVRKGSPTYALVVAKNGHKLEEILEPGGFFTSGELGKWSASAAPMDLLIRQLNNVSDRPVIDETGLKSRYAFELTWTPDFRELPNGRGRRDRGMLDVVESQLGLKLERRSMAMDYLIIDHMEKMPSPN